MRVRWANAIAQCRKTDESTVTNLNTCKFVHRFKFGDFVAGCSRCTPSLCRWTWRVECGTFSVGTARNSSSEQLSVSQL